MGHEKVVLADCIDWQYLSARMGDERLQALVQESLHVAEVECIGKGKAHKPYQFGVKVSVATTLNRCKGGQFARPCRDGLTTATR